jgi:hypothetical protein
MTYLAAFFGAAAFFTGFAGLDLPNDPLKILPFFVFLSPLPMNIIFLTGYKNKR